MVILATMLMTYIPKPSLADCCIVAKSLITEYPFLSDTEGDGEVSKATNIYMIATYCIVIAFLEMVYLLPLSKYKSWC